MAGFWKRVDREGNAVVTIQDLAIKDDHGIVAWARGVSDMFFPKKSGDRFSFTVVRGSSESFVAGLLKQVAKRLDLEDILPCDEPKGNAVPLTDSDHGRFVSRSVGASVPKRGIAPPIRGQNWKAGW